MNCKLYVCETRSSHAISIYYRDFSALRFVRGTHCCCTSEGRSCIRHPGRERWRQDPQEPGQVLESLTQDSHFTVDLRSGAGSLTRLGPMQSSPGKTRPGEANRRRSRSASPNSPLSCGSRRPTVYDWLDGGEPNADDRRRIRTLMGLLVDCRVSAAHAIPRGEVR